MSQFTRVDQVCKLFLNQGNTLIGSRQPGRDTFDLLRTSQILVAEWGDVIDRFDCITDQGTSPHIRVLCNLFATLVTQVDDVIDMAHAGTIRSAVPPDAIERLQTDATALRRASRTAGFDPATFGDRVLGLGRRVARVFRTAVPWGTMATGAVIRTRVAVNATCNELVRIAQGMTAFAALAAKVRADIARASDALNRLLNYLAVGLAVKIESREELGEDTRKPTDCTDMEGAKIDDKRAGEVF
jgi:hypothetical protein